MKKLFLIFTLLFAFNANAGEEINFEGKELILLNAVHNNCPIEFIQAMYGAHSVGKASLTIGLSEEVYSLTTVGGNKVPSFNKYDVATLTITRKALRHELPPTDAPPNWNVSCDVTWHNK